MDESIGYRLVLTRAFLDQARISASREDMTSCALAVVNLHDAFDNLSGAIATQLGVQVAEGASMLKTFDRIATAVSIPYRVKLSQLNTLRNAVKHDGLHPNPVVVRQLVAELILAADELAIIVFKRPVSSFRTIDLLLDADLRNEASLVEALIEAGDFRAALEQVAYLLFQVYESEFVREERLGAAKKVTTLPSCATARYDFPAIDEARQRLDFVALGLDPLEYDSVHAIVPRVGLMITEHEIFFILKKDPTTWHATNWTLQHATYALEFVVRLILAWQRRVSCLPVITWRYSAVRLRFNCDSSIFVDDAGTQILRRVREGEEIDAWKLQFVDGAWQDFGEERAHAEILDKHERKIGYFNKCDVRIVQEAEA